MHLYNAWLPPMVAEETKKEAESFASVVRSVKGSWRPDDPNSVYDTLKWIPIIDLFLKAKSDISPGDVKNLVEFGLELFHASQGKLYPQVMWGRILITLLKKHGKRLSIDIHWRPFYDNLMLTHFKRNTGPEGWRLKQKHIETVTSLVQSCRKFFPAGSSSEIWSEFRPFLDNPWHYSAFEGSGFLRLFLTMNSENQNYFTGDWVEKSLNIWDSMPNCQFWDIQWASIIARCIKNCKSIDWEGFLPTLFTKYLNMFEVPVSNGVESYSFPIYVPWSVRFLFSSNMRTPCKAIAKSIVYLLKPQGSAQEYFERLANLLEQYYHPSNEGHWTDSLTYFLWHLVITFQKRLQHELHNTNNCIPEEFCLGKLERASFVNVVLKLIAHGQYSKDEDLSDTVTFVTSILSYVEPSLVLPFIASRFEMALQTMTATHQLKTALTSVAFAGRAIFLVSTFAQTDKCDTADVSLALVLNSLSNALLGIDANDPPKTLASMQLICSIYSSLTIIGSSDSEPVFQQTISLSEWLDCFFSRLFSLLRHAESTGVINDVLPSSTMEETFLIEDDPYYFCMLEILLGKLSKVLFNQSLEKISKFVNTNILPGATKEVGLLCCACVKSKPEEAATYLIKPILETITSSLRGTPISGLWGSTTSDTSSFAKAALSPTLEIVAEYLLKVLARAIRFAGTVLLHYREELKEVNVAGGHVLCSLLGSLVLYYPVNQFMPLLCQPASAAFEPWGCSKDYNVGRNEPLNLPPKWHISSQDELSFANELLELHFQSALDDLSRICETRIHTNAGTEKEHLKITLLRIKSSLQGVMSCLPDMRPCDKRTGVITVEHSYFVIAGAVGSSVGSPELRERAANIIHQSCKFLLEQRADDSILLILIIRVIDALGNFGSFEYEEWLDYIQDHNLNSAVITEPPCNFIVSSHAQGKKWPRWAFVDKSYMHNMWRSSQSSYHKFCLDSDIVPSQNMNLLMENLLDLALHSYERVRLLAGRSLSRMLKRCPSFIASSVLTLIGNLNDPKVPEHVVLGSCRLLEKQNFLNHLTMEDAKLFPSFIQSLLASSHFESLKAQKAVIKLFLAFNKHFSVISRSFFKTSDAQSRDSRIADLVSQISLLSSGTTGRHWRYNLMANRVLLLLTLSSRNHSSLTSNMLGEAVGHFLRDLKSKLPHSRILAISALNALLEGTRCQDSSQDEQFYFYHNKQLGNSSIGRILNQIIQEEGLLSEALNSLSLLHIDDDSETSASKGYIESSFFQSVTDEELTSFYFDFLAQWPRTPCWIPFPGVDKFHPNFARIFQRLAQECGTPILHALMNIIEQFSSAKERSKQSVAAEVLAGILHSDVSGLPGAWDSWMMLQLQKIMVAPSLESIPEWASCIQYAVTGKGKNGTQIPVLRQRIFNCLEKTSAQSASTSAIVARRYFFLSVALTEISPPTMPVEEFQYHKELLKELLCNMSHSSAKVRESVGTTLSIICSNMRLFALFGDKHLKEAAEDINMVEPPEKENWAKILMEGTFELSKNIIANLHTKANSDSSHGIMNTAVEADIRRMETIFHFIISSLKSGRSSFLLDILVGNLYPILSLQDISNKDLSALAKAAFKLLSWRILPRPFLERFVSVILSSINDSNWRTRYESITFLGIFMYRHTFTLSRLEKSQIWQNIEKLLVDKQVEVREHAALILASLMKGGDRDLYREFRDRSYAKAQSVMQKGKPRKTSHHSVASIHGVVLALAASILSVPYDMPSWLPNHVTLLAQFVDEPYPTRSTVTKTVAEFRRTHADTWDIQKHVFTEEQLEVLADTSFSFSYFA
ncbi:proteasome activator subunit 4-like isoform X2 [Ananas comosus]|uniref:Proteasome activator subunit 4-like isoform X2 n=1 Tax=Ananas comosus TaxID=4615 RepID=A0A6P5GV95_ANACO|nr:proteasome activator subunit 4-like isoform X2 [Ananas comosus]